MNKVYGVSDDVVSILDSNGLVEHVDCPNMDALISFSDGTRIRVGYGKPFFGVWYIFIENEGFAVYQKLTNCFEKDGPGDEFIIDADIAEIQVVARKEWTEAEEKELMELANVSEPSSAQEKKFNPGDVVFVVERDAEGNVVNDVSGFIFLSEVNNVAFLSPKVNGQSSVAYLLDYCIKQARLDNDNCCIRAYPIADCYPTLIEAETALDKAQF